MKRQSPARSGHPLLLWIFIGLLPNFADASEFDLFEKSIRPALIRHCHECHSGDDAKAGLRLDFRGGWETGGKSGPAIIPGNPASSLLIQAIRHANPDLKMPRGGGQIPQAVIAEFEVWVRSGAPDPRDKPAAAANAKYLAWQSVLDQGRQWWSLQPITKTPPPQVANEAWPQSPIDQFILARLETAELSPNLPAAKRTLIRRLYFDLLGLPPPPADIAAFLNDDSPNAFSQLVDRLLASPHYGERWGRHWLDTARYADSNGHGNPKAYPNAWRYRDYVIDAFNQDTPYDQFLTEQLAGDLLPPTNNLDEHSRRLTATGFLALSPKLLTEQDKERMIMDVVDEQIDVTSRAIMGFTFACARCHDHKFDPISTRDYYALASVFRSSQTLDKTDVNPSSWMERPLEFPGITAKRLPQEKEIASVKKIIATDKKTLAKLRKTKPPDASKIDELEKKLKNAEELLKEAESHKIPTPPHAMAVRDLPKPRNLRVHIAGDHKRPGEPAPRGFPDILNGDHAPAIDDQSSGRLQLAQWLTSDQHPLTARVLVNRIWQSHFGRGLAATTDNFGKLGEAPTHPQLLDWLAADFIENGFSLKYLHRRILLSSTWQMSGDNNATAFARDSDNRLLWRINRRRLDAEPLRDAILASAGQLDLALGGTLFPAKPGDSAVDAYNKQLATYDHDRRSVYLPVIRSAVYDMFQIFDFGDPSVVTTTRAETTVPTQSLFLMNSPFVRKQATQFASRFARAAPGDTDRQIRLAYEIALSRPPTASELDRATQHISTSANKDESRRQFAQMLFCLNEFIYVE
jgi:hypothetical protein